MSSDSWQAIVGIGVCYISYLFFGLLRSDEKNLSRPKQRFINVGIASTVGNLIFLAALSLSLQNIYQGLVVVLWLTWTSTLVGIVLQYQRRISRFSSRLAMMIFISAPLVGLFSHDRLSGFFRRLDNVPKTLSIDDSQTLVTDKNKKNVSRLDLKVLVPSETEVPKRPILSLLFKGIYIFSCSFTVLSFYGSRWRERFRDRKEVKSQSLLEIDSINQAISFVAIAASIWITVFLMGLDSISLSVLTGLVAIALSVSLRELLTNFVSGMLLIWDRSIKIGDVISFTDRKYGVVSGVTLRYMIIKDRNDISYLIPHSQLIKQNIENWTKDDRKVRLKLDVGVAYGSPIARVKSIMMETCLEFARVVKNPLPNILVVNLGDSSINLQIRFRVVTPEKGVRNIKSDIYSRLLERFEKEGIEIPFPQREIRVLTDNDIEETSSIIQPPYLHSR